MMVSVPVRGSLLSHIKQEAGYEIHRNDVSVPVRGSLLSHGRCKDGQLERKIVSVPVRGSLLSHRWSHMEL